MGSFSYGSFQRDDSRQTIVRKLSDWSQTCYGTDRLLRNDTLRQNHVQLMSAILHRVKFEIAFHNARCMLSEFLRYVDDPKIMMEEAMVSVP